MAESIRTGSIWCKITSAYGHWPGIGPVLIVAAMLRLGVIALIRSYLHPETWEFGPLVASINAGLGYTIVLRNGMRVPSAYMPPAYPYLLAWVLRLGGDRPATYLLIEIIQAGFGVLLVYVVYRVALVLIGERGAIAAACITAIYPAQIYMCNEFHGINIYIVLGIGVVLFLVRYLEETQSWKDLIAAGLCMGLLMLFRAEAPALLLLYAIILALRGGRKAIGPAIVFVLVATACLAPWTVRNYREFNKFIPVCASGGVNLWIGNNPRATGSQHYSFFDPIPPDVKKAFDQIPLDKNEPIAKDNALRQLAVSFIRTHPRQDAVLVLKKLFIFFVYDPSHEKGRNLAYWLPSVLLTVLAIWGAVLRGRKLIREDIFLIVSILLSITVSIVVFALPRYKIVIDPFIIILVANVFAANGLGNLQRSEGKVA